MLQICIFNGALCCVAYALTERARWSDIREVCFLKSLAFFSLNTVLFSHNQTRLSIVSLFHLHRLCLEQLLFFIAHVSLGLFPGL